MSKGYIIIFTIFLALPVFLAIGSLTYFCFKISPLVGFLVLGGCLAIITFIVIIIALKIARGKNK